MSIATNAPLTSNDGAALIGSHEFTLIVLDLTSLFVIVHLSASVQFLDDMIFVVVVVAGAAGCFFFFLLSYLDGKKKDGDRKIQTPRRAESTGSTEDSLEDLLNTRRTGTLWEPNDRLSCRPQAL